ncbi:MAG TPA: CC/Se motif family (seleno)protein [Syntrophales bacterium]|nr:CC/Se motif family (seleno)protein [Syntrophales bacterium]
MLTITPEAKAYVLDNGGTLFLEYIVLKGGCCVPYQPEPTVRLGRPRGQDKYRQEAVDGITMFIPRELPQEELTIDLTSLMGRKRLVIEGWRHF